MKHPTEAEIFEQFSLGGAILEPSAYYWERVKKAIAYALSLQSEQEGKVWTDEDMKAAFEEGEVFARAWDADQEDTLPYKNVYQWLTNYKKSKQ